MKTGSFRIAGVALAVILTVPIGPAAPDAIAQTAPAQSAGAGSGAQVPQPDEGGVNWSGVGYGAGAVFGNVLYIPAKLVYALTGSLVGGGAYLLTAGNAQTADTIWRSSLGEISCLRPTWLRVTSRSNFSGPTTTPPETQSAAPQSGQAASAESGSPGSSVAPIAPLPPAGAGQPMDRGSGPAAPAGAAPQLPSTSIE